MNKLMVILAAATLATLAACSEKEEATPPPDTDTVEEGVFDPMVDTIERARQVEMEVENRVKDMNRQLEEIEGNDQP